MADDPKRIGVASLKAKLSEHLRAVEDGETIVVLNHNRPVARIVPYEEEAPEWKRWVRRAKDPRPASVVWAELRAERTPIDPKFYKRAMELLREDRER